MKYGETLRQRSIPAWQTHNIDYEDIKQFIKENTTPGNGKAVSIPGKQDVSGRKLEVSLFSIFEEQNERITWFVRSKTGEIKRRLSHLDDQVHGSARQRNLHARHRLSMKRLERYGRIENEIIKVGDEIKSLARFIGVQQTAFRKLLKKYKKWTGSVELEERLQAEVLGAQGSFCNIDLLPLLAHYEQLLDAVRTLYSEGITSSRTSRLPNGGVSRTASGRPVTSPFSHVKDIVEHGRQVEFDHLISTLKIGSSGANAVYWVHPENAMELQVLLSQHARPLHAYRRHSSVSPETSTPTAAESPPSTPHADNARSRMTFDVIADDQTRYLQKKSSQTLEGNEGRRGSTLQAASLHARGSTTEDVALLAWHRHGPSSSSPIEKTIIKRKAIQSFIERDPSLEPQKAAVPAVSFADAETSSAGAISDVRHWLNQHPDIHPLATILSERSRFYDINHDASGVLLATLDHSVSIHYGVTLEPGVRGCSNFPFSVLRIRQEGPVSNNLMKTLESSHLVERVRGFSLEYHAVWDACRPADCAPPFWLSMMNADLRKLPQQPPKRVARTDGSEVASGSTTPAVLTSTSSEGWTPGDRPSTADGPRHEPIEAGDHIIPRRPRKQRQQQSSQTKSQYWSEYDHPEDSDDENAYVIYITPDQESWFDRAWTSFTNLFHTTPKRSEHSHHIHHNLEAPSPTDSDDSDDESKPLASHPANAYGTLSQIESQSLLGQSQSSSQTRPFSKMAALCLMASIIILVTAFLLAATGRKKLASEVDAGVFVSVAASLFFAIIAVVAVFRQRDKQASGWLSRVACLTVLGIDAIACGGLLAWIIA